MHTIGQMFNNKYFDMKKLLLLIAAFMMVAAVSAKTVGKKADNPGTTMYNAAITAGAISFEDEIMQEDEAAIHDEIFDEGVDMDDAAELSGADLDDSDSAPVASIFPSGFYLHPFLTYTSKYLSNYAYAMMPAYGPVSFTNLTTGTTTGYEWVVATSSDSITATTTDFTFTPTPGTYTTAPTLTAYNGTASDSFTWGKDSILASKSARVYSAYMGENWTSSSVNFVVGLACYDNASSNITSYGTPDVNSSYTITDIYSYQGTPEAPLYFEGIKVLCYKLTADTSSTVTCQIRKATMGSNGHSLTIGDLIAESKTITTNSTSGSRGEINFTDFYSIDEDGDTTALDHIFVEDEFLIQLTDWDNGTFTNYGISAEKKTFSTGIYRNYIKKKNATSLTYFTNTRRLAIGFTDAVYGYLYTEDDLTYTAPAEGGTKTISINPYLCSVDSDGNYTTRLFVEDGYEIPDWLTISTSNESYSSTYSFDLVLTAEANNTSDTRTATVRLYQEGAYIDVVVTQEPVTSGISEVSCEAAPVVTVDGDIITLGDASGVLYTAAGQKVGAGTGEIDASGLSTGVYIVKLSDGTAVKVVK